MIYYYRILINDVTKQVEHCVVDTNPLSDYKILSSEKDDQQEIFYTEWNGIYNHTVQGRFSAHILFTSLVKNVNDLNDQPVFEQSEKHREKNIVVSEKNNRQRNGAGDINKVMPLDISKITDKKIIKGLSEKLIQRK